MPARRPDEDEEWLNSRIESCAETYKKAMLTPAILALIAEHQPEGIATITDALTKRTGWQITERGLYRNVVELPDNSTQ